MFHRNLNLKSAADKAASSTPLREIAPRVLGFTKPHFKILLLGTIALALGSGINLLFPWLLKVVLNAESGFSLSNNLGQITLVLIALFFLQSLFFYCRHLCFHIVGYKVVAELRSRLYEKMLVQDISFFDRSRVGDLLSRLSSDTQLMQRAVTVNISVALRYLLQVLGGIALMLYISPKLSLFILVVIPVFMISGAVFGKKLRKLSRLMQDQLAEASVVAEESLSSIKTVRNFVGENFEISRYGKAISKALDAGLARAGFGAAFSSSMVFVMNSAIALMLWFGASLVVQEKLSLGDLSAFLLYCSIVAVSFAFLIGVWDDFMQAVGASERIFAILDQEPWVKTPLNPQKLPTTPPFGSIGSAASSQLSFNNISFSYPSRPDIKVLENLSFTIQTGETLALVGPSGAGKSTIASLIPRFYDPDQGRIEYLGIDLKKLSLSELRSQIAVVEQNPQVFSVSIKENILYGRPEASNSDLEKAAHAANIMEFISSLPQGFDTLVGDRGIQLSGGEKQRIAIARAVLKNAPFLILDEATSSLDSQNEKLVQAALDQLMQGRTALVIAHRLSTVKHADRVLVLKNGLLCQQGTHQTLVQEDGLYKTLVNHQLL